MNDSDHDDVPLALEQTQRLLDEQHESGDYTDEKSRQPARSITLWRRLRLSQWWEERQDVKIAVFAGLVLLAFFLLFRMVPAPGSRYSIDATSNKSISRPDYGLDANWNAVANPRRREYWWTVEDLEHNPDGVYRPMIVINRQFPGPLIECNEGDTIVVHVQNEATNSTSVHWHGIYQNGTNWMDGTVGITQCPIAPGGSFTYEFKISGQSGTYWYHAHLAVQSSDGLHGPLIVHSANERQLQEVPYDTDRVVMIGDHYHDTSSALLMDYLASDRENEEPVPDGGLINGMNVRDCDSLPHRKCDNSTASFPTIRIAPEQNHRLRLINVGAFAEFQVQVDEHQFAVTEVDGTDVKPAYYHRLNINPGQRYSIILSANSSSGNSFWLRASMLTTCFAYINPYLESEIKAIIEYDSPDSPNQDSIQFPISTPWDSPYQPICKDMNTTELVPVVPVAAPEQADSLFYLRSNFEIGAYRLSRGFFNASSWRPDVHSPSLNRVIEGYSMDNQSFLGSSYQTGINSLAFDTNRELVLQIPGIQTIDIVVQNFDDGNHPLHLHGYKFWVLGQGHGYFHQDFYNTLDLSNPLRRDTASVETYGWTLIRLVTDNPGMWALHCHIAWHNEAGMLMQILTRPEVVATWDLPEANQELCKAEGLERGMGPKDEDFMVDGEDDSDE